MNQTHRIILIGLLLGALLILAAGSTLLVRHVPGAARLFRGDPAPPSSGALPPATAGLSTAPRTEWLAFESQRGRLNDYEIVVMTTDGSRVTNLTQSWADDVSPVWSPDGLRIAFVTLRDTPAGKWGMGPGSIYLIDFDPTAGRAGGLFRLTDGTGDDGWPTWSPDGQWIVFESDRGGDREIWRIRVDGSDLTRLTNSPGEDRHPDWAPDGTRIAFTSERGGDKDIWVMAADGSNPVNLTHSAGRDRYPAWSPDGRRLAFNTLRDGNQEIYIMNADGSEPWNVTRSPSIEGLADWSPDGQRMVLYSDLDDNKEIYVVDLATGRWTNVSRDPASDEFCTWSP